MIPTAHINLDDKSKIAKTVLMPGDPLRAKFIADNFLEDVEQFNSTRGMLGFTGTYKGRRISVMGSGMGQPSIGIYSFELFTFYDVENIVRVGSCGAYTEELNVFDVLIAEDAWSETTFAKVQGIGDDYTFPADKELNEKLIKAADNLNIPVRTCRMHSTDVFYRGNFDDYKTILKEHNCLAVDMESYALFANAKATGKRATTIQTVSDSLCKPQNTTSEQREKSFTDMMKIALELAE